MANFLGKTQQGSVTYKAQDLFSKNLIPSAIINEIEEKIKALKIPRNFSCHPVLIHITGVTDDLSDQGYFSKIIYFSRFLKE